MRVAKPIKWKRKFARYTAIVRWPLLALLPTMLAACSTTQYNPPMPELPANLAHPCQELPMPPDPLVGPARDLWEATIIALYGDCAARHRYTVGAWPKRKEVAQ